MFGSHPSKPMVDECGLSDPGSGNDGNDVRRMKNKWINPESQKPLLPVFGAAALDPEPKKNLKQN